MSYVAGKVKTFSCPNCGGSVAVHAVGISITATCKHCSCVIDMANDNLKVISTATSKTREIDIAIGTRATLFEHEWEVIGYVEREINNSYGRFSWEEYLLFNPWQGFRFLVCSDGHWTFVKTIHKEIKESGGVKAECEGQEYKLFSRDVAKVSYVMGEFYWRVKVGEQARVSDFIAPPYVISKEENEQEVVWSQGIYVEKDLIKQAFKLPFLREPQNIAPNQPSPVTQYVPGIKKLSALFFGILCLIQLFGVNGFAENKTVFSQKLHAMPEQKDQVVLSAPLELSGKTSNVEITVSSPVENNWLELITVLNNDETQQTFDAAQVIEYYHGYDSDGSWSEGSRQTDTTIAAVPAGKYHLLLSPDAGAYEQGQPVDFDITIKRDVPNSSNFWFALLALLFFPAIVLYRHWSFEKRRWEDSDFAPAQYKTAEASDD